MRIGEHFLNGRRVGRLLTGLLCLGLLALAGAIRLDALGVSGGSQSALAVGSWPHIGGVSRPVRQWIDITPPQVTLVSGAPESGGTWAMAMDPRHTGTLYVGTARQGIYKTTNGGKSWFKVDTGAGSDAIDSGSVWTLEIDPMAPNVLYAAPGYGRPGLWKSTDGGVNWKDVTDGSPAIKGADLIGAPWINDVAIDPWNHRHLIAACKYLWGGKYGNNAGVLESKDAGATWIVHAPQSNFYWQNYVYFLNNSRTWIFTTFAGAYFRTTDAGTTWSKVTIHGADPGYEDLEGDMYRAPDGSYYLGGKSSLYRSTDNGVTWNEVWHQWIAAVVGDGSTLYSQAVLSTSTGGYGPTTYIASPERDGTHWAAYSSQTTCSHAGCSGPGAMVYDPVHRIVYSSNFYAGVWKLPLGRSKG